MIFLLIINDDIVLPNITQSTKFPYRHSAISPSRMEFCERQVLSFFHSLSLLFFSPSFPIVYAPSILTAFESLRTTLCLQFKPQLVAAAAIYLAAKFLTYTLPEGKKPWWEVLDAKIQDLEGLFTFLFLICL